MRFPAAALLLASMAASGCSSEPATRSNPLINPTSNVVSVTAGSRILWNRQPVTEQQLETLIEKAAERDPEPELVFEPDLRAGYDLSARIIGIIENSRSKKFGFVGHEFYPESDAPSD